MCWLDSNKVHLIAWQNSTVEGKEDTKKAKDVK